MNNSASINLVTNPELEKLVQQRLDVKAGDRLEGRVLELKDDGKAVIDFGKFKAETDLNVPVQEGDTIRMVVVESGKQIKLKIQQVIHQQQTQQGVGELMKEGDVQQEKSIAELYNRINRLLDKEIQAQQSRGSEDTPTSGKTDARVLEDIGKELNRLKQYVETKETNEPLPKELKQDVKELLKQVETTLKQLPESDSSNQTERLEALSKAIKELRSAIESNRDIQELRDKVIDEVKRLDIDVKDLELQGKGKENIDSIMNRLMESADKLENLKTADQLQDLRRIVTEEIKPDLNQLQKALQVEIEAASNNPDVRKQLEQIQQQAQNLEKSIEVTLKHASSANIEDIEVILKDLQHTLQTGSSDTAASTPPTPATSTSETPVTTNLPELHQDIYRELSRLHQVLKIPVEAEQQSLPPEVKPQFQQLLERVETTLAELPETATRESSQSLEALFREVKTLRTTLDNQQDFQQLKTLVLKEVDRLSQLSQQLDGPQKEQIEAVIGKLTEAAEKIDSLSGPEQLQQLRQIVSREINPQLSQLAELAEMAQIPQTSGEASVNPEQVKIQQQIALEINMRASQLQGDIDAALQRMPETSTPPRNLDTLIQNVESALSKVEAATVTTEAPVAQAEPPQFSESIQSIYDNIKVALRLLQNNLKVSGGQLEIPEEILQIFQNLQSDLKAAEATDSTLQQLAQLKEMIQKADLPIEKVVNEIVDSLTEIMERIAQLQDQREFGQIRTLVQERLGTQLKMLGDVLSSAKLLGAVEGKDLESVASIHSAIRQLQGGIEKAFVQTDVSNQSTELTRLTEITGQLASLNQDGTPQVLAEGQTSDTVAQLAKNVQELLSRLPSGSGNPDDTSGITEKISGLLKSVQSHFEPLDIGQEALKLVPKLKSLVDDSGIFFEKKIADVINNLTEASSKMQDVNQLSRLPEIRSILENDMKPHLSQLKELLANPKAVEQFGDPKALESVRQAVDDLLNNIGTQQDRAVQNQLQQVQPSQQSQIQQVQVFSFQLPIQGENSAQLKVFYNKGRKKDSSEEFRLSLLLNMEHIGDIRSDFFSLKEDLTITFFVRDQEVKEQFKDHLSELEEALEPMFGKTAVNIMVSREKLAEFEAEEFKQIISEEAVDVKI